MEKKFLKKNYGFSPEIHFFSKNHEFEIAMSGYEWTDLSRIEARLISRLLRPSRSQASVSIKRYGLFSDDHFQKIMKKLNF